MTARWYQLCKPLGLPQCGTCRRNEDRDPVAARAPAQKWLTPRTDAMGRRCVDAMSGDPAPAVKRG